jgi:hypothetical protein
VLSQVDQGIPENVRWERAGISFAVARADREVLARTSATMPEFHAGSPWLSFYGVTQAAPNLTRITVDGSSNAVDYLRVSVHARGPQALTRERVPFSS